MNAYVFPIAIAAMVVLLLLIVILAALNAKARESRTRKALGLPANSKLPKRKEQHAMQAFVDTDVRLKKTFPTLSERQRHVMARSVLRHKGVLPKQTGTA